MTDKERIQAIEKRMAWSDVLPAKDANFLLRQLKQRDKTIAEKDDLINRGIASHHWYQLELHKAQQQNKLMLSALESIERGSFSTRNAQVVARDTIAQVKALPVSRQGETSDASVTSEQP